MTASLTTLSIARKLSATQQDDKRSLIDRRDEGELHVWLAEGIVAAGFAYLLFMGVLTLGSTIGLFAPLALGTTLWCIGQLSRQSDGWSIVSRPLLQTGFVLPLLTVLVGMIRHTSAFSCPAIGLAADRTSSLLAEWPRMRNVGMLYVLRN